ncbi:MAG TPA: ammonium transporter, partial [Verrucomicrobiales bacterium]|nr:ammonium transporter [Verrucomicrobiales bacterium]
MDWNPLNIAWVMICTALVFVMQAGFCCLECGFVRSKNSINVAAKNLVDFCLAFALFWVVGYGVMFGDILLRIKFSDLNLGILHKLDAG